MPAQPRRSDACDRLLDALRRGRTPDGDAPKGEVGRVPTGELGRARKGEDGRVPKAEVGRVPAGCADRRGRTALSIACGAGGTGASTLDALGAAGYRVDEPDKDGLRPLAYASWQGVYHAAKWLLDRGAAAGDRDDFGVAAIHKAVSFGRAAIVAEILARDASLADLPTGEVSHRAASLYEAESKLEFPLHLCARSGWAATERQRLDVASTLINAGASLEVRDVDGVTPLRAAVACREVLVARALLDAGADPGPLDSAPWARAPEFRARLFLASFGVVR